jgi:hypothetical protein
MTEASKKRPQNTVQCGLSSPIQWTGCMGRTLMQSRKPDAEAEQEQRKTNLIEGSLQITDCYMDSAFYS